MSSVPPKDEKRPRSKRGFILAIIAGAAVVLSGLSFILLQGNPKGASIDLMIPSEAQLGDPFEAKISFRNESQSEMKDVTISMALPRGVSFAEGDGEARTIRSVGMVAKDEIVEETFKLVVSEGADEEKDFKAEADYIPGGVSRHISITKEAKVRIKKPVEVSIDMPDKAVSGEEFDWSIALKNNYKEDMKVKVSAEPSKDLTTDFKVFEASIRAGEEIKKQFKGSAILTEGEVFNIKVSISGDIKGQGYLFDEKTGSSVIALSPLSLKAELKGKGSDYVVSPGERLDYAVTVRNNSDIPLQSILIRGVLKGVMYDIDSVSAKGTVDKAARLVTWDMSSDEVLKEIAPGESRSFDLSVALISDYPIKRLSDRNFSVELAVRAESPTVPYFVKSLKTVNIASAKNKLAGKLAVEARGYFRDAVSGILNDGELPPTVGQATEATVHWTIASPATDMESVEIRAEIPPGVELTGDKKSDVGELSIDKDKGEVIWRVPKVLATTGILSKPIEAIFQVKFTPMSSATGGYMAILGDTMAYATDGFTGKKVESGSGPLTTEFTDDKTIRPNEGIVR